MRAFRRVIALALALPAMVSFSSSPALGWSDNIGVFFDTSGTTTCAGPAPYTTLTAYVLALGVSEPSGISRWECALVTEPATLPAGVTVTLENGGANALSAPDYAVSLPASVPCAPIIRLATWSSFYLGGSINFGIGPAHPGHFLTNPGPGYAAGNDTTRWVRLSTPCGAPDQPDAHYVACVGGPCCSVDEDPCVTPAMPDTWGAVKRIYE